MKKFYLFIIMTAIMAMTAGCRFCLIKNPYVTSENGKFISNGNTHYYIGTNFWYGPILASDTEANDIERLKSELDSLKALGINNLRVLVGAEGPEGSPNKIWPVLQKEPGVYDENVFIGLDRFMYELGKRDMKAVLYLTNSWEWSGGFGQYLQWAGAGDIVLPQAGWKEFTGYTSRIMVDEKARQLIAQHVKTIVSRINTVTGKPYCEDPAIFSWQLANEPRCFSASKQVQDAFVEWVYATAALIKSIDGNHLVSTGSEGLYGCEVDMELCERIHACPDIDYINLHIWPFNWKWVSKEGLLTDIDKAIESTDSYLDAHIKLAEKLNKPLVLEEFGYPRDGLKFAKGTPVNAKDLYYTHIFQRLIDSKKTGGKLAGVNFWGWGGMAEQSSKSIWWNKGDDFCCDPAHEQQGLYSVYLSDTTSLNVIRDAQQKLSEIR